MSPNPPMTPSSMSNSEGSPMTALTSPLSSGRSSTGQYSQYHKAASQIPPSPANDHYRSKSYSSGPIPLTIPLESSPKESSPAPSPYGSPSKPQSNRGSVTPSRKMNTDTPRDHYRRSESYSTLQARSNFANTSNTSIEPNALRQDIDPSSVDQGNRRDSWREQEQFLLQLQQRDHQARAKQKRESFYAAFQNAANTPTTTTNTNNNGSSGNNSNSSVNNEEPKGLKSQSRAASPHLPSGIPQLRTRSRSGVPSTPTDLRGRPTPPPRSRSRTPAGSAGAGVSAPVSQQPQVPQQYSGELQSILRKSVVILDEPSVVPTSPHRSPASSTPNSKSGTPLPQTADTIPVPIADISKHLSGLDLKEHARTPSAVEPTPSITLRQQTSNLTSSHRRSIVFDIPKAPVRMNGNGTESHVGKMKDVGVMVSGAKERTSIFSSAPSTQSTTRKRGKVMFITEISLCRTKTPLPPFKKADFFGILF